MQRVPDSKAIGAGTQISHGASPVDEFSLRRNQKTENLHRRRSTIQGVPRFQQNINETGQKSTASSMNEQFVSRVRPSRRQFMNDVSPSPSPSYSNSPSPDPRERHHSRQTSFFNGAMGPTPFPSNSSPDVLYEARNKIRELNTQLLHQREKREEDKLKLSAIQAHVSRLETTIGSLNESISSQNKEIDSLKKDVRSGQDAVNDANRGKKDLERVLESTVNALSEATKRAEEFNHKFNVQKDDFETLNQKHREDTKRLRAVEARFESSERTRHQKEQLLEEANLTLQTADAQLSALENKADMMEKDFTRREKDSISTIQNLEDALRKAENLQKEAERSRITAESRIVSLESQNKRLLAEMSASAQNLASSWSSSQLRLQKDVDQRLYKLQTRLVDAVKTQKILAKLVKDSANHVKSLNIQLQRQKVENAQLDALLVQERQERHRIGGDHHSASINLDRLNRENKEIMTRFDANQIALNASSLKCEMFERKCGEEKLRADKAIRLLQSSQERIESLRQALDENREALKTQQKLDREHKEKDSIERKIENQRLTMEYQQERDSIRRQLHDMMLQLANVVSSSQQSSIRQNCTTNLHKSHEQHDHKSKEQQSNYNSSYKAAIPMQFDEHQRPTIQQQFQRPFMDQNRPNLMDLMKAHENSVQMPSTSMDGNEDRMQCNDWHQDLLDKMESLLNRVEKKIILK